MIDKARLARVTAIECEDLPKLTENAADPAKDRAGLATDTVAPGRRKALFSRGFVAR